MPQQKVIQVKENHITSAEAHQEVKEQQSMEQNHAVMTATQEQDLSLSLSFCNSLNAHKPLDTLFYHLFHEPNKKEPLEFLNSWLVIVHLTFSHSQPCFPSNVFLTVERSASKPQQNTCIFQENHLSVLKWEFVWGKRDSPKWRQFYPTVSSGESEIIKADQKWTRTDEQSSHVLSLSFKTHTA